MEDPAPTTDDTDPEVEMLQTVYSSLGYQISRLTDGGLRAHHAASNHTSDADSAGGLRRSIIEHQQGRGVHGSLGGLSGK